MHWALLLVCLVIFLIAVARDICLGREGVEAQLGYQCPFVCGQESLMDLSPHATKAPRCGVSAAASELLGQAVWIRSFPS